MDNETPIFVRRNRQIEEENSISATGSLLETYQIYTQLFEEFTKNGVILMNSEIVEFTVYFT